MTRYAAFDSDSDEEMVPGNKRHPFSHYRSSSHAGPSSPRRSTPPRSTLGKRLQSYADGQSSDEDDTDSEAEVLLDLDSSPEKGRAKGMSRSSSAQSSSSRANVSGLQLDLSPHKSRGKARESFKAMLKIVESEPNEYEAWVMVTEQAAWREGHKIAHSRRAELREIALNARAEMREEQSMQAAQDAEEMRRLLEGLALDQSKEEEEARRVFKEREKKLWADIDAAIKRTEELETKRRALEAAAQKQAADAETARKAAADKAADDARAESERRAKEAAEKKRTEELAQAQADQAAQKKREEEAAKRKEVESGGMTGREWRMWVDKQRWIKTEVIERVKADKEVRTGLRQGMRLITRGLGQVVNTRESVLRVTNDVSGILNQQLPMQPSAANPTLLSQPPPQAYSYLLSHFCKALIKQAESEVAAKQDAAFPLARIVLGLLLRGHAALGEVLVARLVKKCPWIVPFWPSRRPDQPRTEYEKSTGRGSDESIPDYTQRMAGIATLYFAILQTPLASLVPTLPSPPTPDQLVVLVTPALRLPAAWTWLAHALREPMPSLPPIAHLVANWIEICGYEVGRIYGGKQLGKVYDAIRREGVQEGKIKGDSEASRQRLGILLEGNMGAESSGRNWD